MDPSTPRELTENDVISFQRAATKPQQVSHPHQHEDIEALLADLRRKYPIHMWQIRKDLAWLEKQAKKHNLTFYLQDGDWA